MEKQHPYISYMSLYGYSLVLYYAHYAIIFDENTFYFNFTSTFTSYIVIIFSFSYHYTFTTLWLGQKTLFFLLIIKLISSLRLYARILKNNIFLFHCYYYYVHYSVILTKKILFLTFTTFIFLATTFTSSTTFNMTWSR